MKYKTKNITPKSMNCIVASCPAIYESLRERTPGEMKCMVSACPSYYEATLKRKEVYLIIGKVINPADAGLEAKVGEGEALIEVPKALIDNKGK